MKKLLIRCVEFTLWLLRLVLLSFIIHPLQAFLGSVADLVANGKFTLPSLTDAPPDDDEITDEDRREAAAMMAGETLYEHPDGSMQSFPFDPHQGQRITIPVNGMWTSVMPEPMSGGLSAVRVCKNWAAAVRVFEVAEAINALDVKSPRVRVTLNGRPIRLDDMDLDPRNNPEDMNTLEVAGPYYIDVRCDSTAKMEQMMSDVEALEFEIHKIRTAAGIKVIGPENCPTRPWPWHEADDVPENALPVDKVPRWDNEKFK